MVYEWSDDNKDRENSRESAKKTNKPPSSPSDTPCKCYIVGWSEKNGKETAIVCRFGCPIHELQAPDK